MARRSKTKKLARKIIISLLFITYFILVFLLNSIGVFSNNIILIAVASLFVIALILSFFLYKAKKKAKKLTLSFICILAIAINIIGIYYLGSTVSFLKGFGAKHEISKEYYVMVLNDSKYNSIKDLQNKKIGITEEITKDALSKLTIKYKKESYLTKEKLIEGLNNKEVEAIILTDAQLFLLEEVDVDLAKSIRTLQALKVTKMVEEEVVEKDVTKDPFVIFISGIDVSGHISTVSRSDVNIVVTINPKTHEVLLTTIPRDFHVQLHGTTGLKDKLTHAGLNGIDMTVATVEDLLDIDIDYYAKVNFDTLPILVDEIGGIDIYSDRKLSLDIVVDGDLDWCNYKRGKNHVDGICALRFARERHSYESGDRHRGENQEEVIKAIITKAQSSTVLLRKYNSILNKLNGKFETNVTNDVIRDLIGLQLKDMPTWNIKTLNLNGENSHAYTYTYPDTWLFVMEPDQELLKKVKTTIKGMIKGKTFVEVGL